MYVHTCACIHMCMYVFKGVHAEAEGRLGAFFDPPPYILKHLA